MEVKSYLLEIIISIFGIILTVLGTLLITYFRDMRKDVNKMSGSMVDMNTKLEVVINDVTWHKEEMKDIKEEVKENKVRINDLEKGE